MIRKEWEEEDPVLTILNTVRDYIYSTNDMFKNELHKRILTKKCIEHFFLCYFETFVWMVKNAFHGDKVFVDFIPRSLNIEVEKETGRKYIKIFLKNSILLKKCLNRDISTFEEFFDNFKEEMTDGFQRTAKANSRFLYTSIFANNEEETVRVEVRYIQEAIRFLSTKLK